MTIIEGATLVVVATGLLVPCIGWWWNSRELRLIRERDIAPVPVLWRAERLDLLERIDDMPFEISINGVAAQSLVLVSLVLRNVGSKDLESSIEFRLTIGEDEKHPVKVLGHAKGSRKMTFFEEKITVRPIDKEESISKQFSIVVPYLNRRDQNPKFRFWLSRMSSIRLECAAPGVELLTPETYTGKFYGFQGFYG